MVRRIHTIDEAATVGLEGLMLVGDLEFLCGTDTERGLSECALAPPLFPKSRVRVNPKWLIRVGPTRLARVVLRISICWFKTTHLMVGPLLLWSLAVPVF